MSDTPRTNANARHVSNLYTEFVCAEPQPSPYCVSADFVRQLERELTTSRACTAYWKRQFEAKSEKVAELEKRLFSMTQTALSEGVRAGKIERELAELNEWKAGMKGVEEFYAMRHQRDEWRKCAEKFATALLPWECSSCGDDLNNTFDGFGNYKAALAEFNRLASKP